MRADVQIFGAGPVAGMLALALRGEGVAVRVSAAPGADATADAASSPGAGLVTGGLVLPLHAENPYRFLAALGPVRGPALVGFLRAGLALNGTAAGPGVLWRCVGPEAGQIAASIEACASLGIPVEPRLDGFRLLEGGGPGRAPSITVDGPPLPAEVEIWASDDGLPPWFADKVTPVRWHRAWWGRAPEGPQARLEVSRHASVYTLHDAQGTMFSGARWAEPHLGVGDRERVPTSDRVIAKLGSLATQDRGLTNPPDGADAVIAAESCDGLPIVGPLPGLPRVLACTGFGISALSWGPAVVEALVAALLGRGSRLAPVGGSGHPLGLPSELSAARFR